MIRILDVLQTPEILEENFARLLDSSPFYALQGKNNVRSLENFPTTHSFGYEKIFYLDKSRTVTKSVFPAYSILFEHQAFLSDSYRQKIASSGSPQLKRTMIKAREYGLDDFVFAYLGVHEYYYTQCEAMNIPAFGAFFEASLDSKYQANATLYDLESPLASSYKPEEITLNASDARKLTVNEIANTYAGDFYKYWICDGYTTNDIIDEKKWMLKREFHYYQKVDITHLKALLWPLELRYNPNTEKTEVKSNITREIIKFKRLHPHVKIFTYVWMSEDGESRFTYASHLITKHLYSVGNLPSEGNFMDDFYMKFSLPKL